MSYREERQTPELIAAMFEVRCVREAAFMVALGRTGVEFDDAIQEAVWDNVAAVAEDFCASPDDIQRVLEMHEPTLAIGIA